MSTLAAMPMQMRLTGSVAPSARVRVPWQRPVTSVSAGLGLGLGSSFVCITDDANQTYEITTSDKAHGTRRSQESST